MCTSRHIIEKMQSLIDSAYTPQEYPALRNQTAEWASQKPLEGLSVLDVTPIFRNTVAKYIPLLAAGARLTVGLSPLISHDLGVVAFLRNAGMDVVNNENVAGQYDIILDCAAAYSHVEPRIGYVELTRSGVSGYEKSEKPVYVADSGRIKRIETMLGTGESYFRAMKSLGYDRWQGRRLVLFGSGKVGSGIAMYGNKCDADVVIVTDPATVSRDLGRQVSSVVDYRDRTAVEDAVRGAYAVVTATGVYGAVGACCAAEVLLNSGALLANMGVEDEFGDDIPNESVLNGKGALNFMLDEPTHLKYIDATMALHNEGARYIASNPDARGLIEPPGETEIKLFEITLRDGIISDELKLFLE